MVQSTPLASDMEQDELQPGERRAITVPLPQLFFSGFGDVPVGKALTCHETIGTS